MSEKKISVFVKSREYTIKVSEDNTILEALRKASAADEFSFACGGNGSCGKCRIFVISGNIPISDEDRSHFSESELEEGFRLACMAVPEGDCVVRLLGTKEDSFEIESRFEVGTRIAREDGEQYVIGIDVGTTTLVVSLVNKNSGNRREVYTGINRQRSYGADVIARIKASTEGEKDKLQELIRKDLLKGIDAVLTRSGITQEQVEKISVAGNTTMGHLLLGYPCDTLGVAPFIPYDISEKELSFAEVFASDEYSIPVYMLPGISTFVGADITAGMLCLGFAQKKEISLLIDLGTNGEMALGNCDRIFVTSTAAGPAFEAGNISCGTGSVAGAICDVEILKDGMKISTIQDASAVGICGTGVIAATAELLEQEYIEDTGLLDEDYFDEGFFLAESARGEKIVLTQKDIREIQLAKSAVRAGMETLLLRYGVTYEQLDAIYLAGGFGCKVNLSKAAAIGLFPEEYLGKIKAVGNSSLQGAIDALTEEEAHERLRRICHISTEIDLSTDKNFQDFYMDYMMFGEE